MKLIMSIVNSEDARGLIDTLMQKNYRATMISSTGGFLREGNSTIFTVTEDDKLEEVLNLIKENCRTRTRYVNPLPPFMGAGELYTLRPLEVEVGGATVFVIPVERFEKF